MAAAWGVAARVAPGAATAAARRCRSSRHTQPRAATTPRLEGTPLEARLNGLPLLQQEYTVGGRALKLVCPADPDAVLDRYIEAGTCCSRCFSHAPLNPTCVRTPAASPLGQTRHSTTTANNATRNPCRRRRRRPLLVPRLAISHRARDRNPGAPRARRRAARRRPGRCEILAMSTTCSCP